MYEGGPRLARLLGVLVLQLIQTVLDSRQNPVKVGFRLVRGLVGVECFVHHVPEALQGILVGHFHAGRCNAALKDLWLLELQVNGNGVKLGQLSNGKLHVRPVQPGYSILRGVIRGDEVLQDNCRLIVEAVVVVVVQAHSSAVKLWRQTANATIIIGKILIFSTIWPMVNNYNKIPYQVLLVEAALQLRLDECRNGVSIKGQLLLKGHRTVEELLQVV